MVSVYTTECSTRLNRGQAIVASLQKIWKRYSNEDTTNKSTSVACSNVRLRKLSWTLRKNEETRLDAFKMKRAEKDSAGFVDSKENK